MRSLALNTTIGANGRYTGRAQLSSSSRSSGRYVPSPNDFIASFYAILRRWKSETAFLSDPEEITDHPSFRAIVENANLVAPLILSELKTGPSLLVWALDDALNENRLEVGKERP